MTSDDTSSGPCDGHTQSSRGSFSGWMREVRCEIMRFFTSKSYGDSWTCQNWTSDGWDVLRQHGRPTDWRVAVEGVAWVPGVWSGCRWAGQKKHRTEGQKTVLCVILLTCVKLIWGVGSRKRLGVHHTLGLHKLGDGGKQWDDLMHHLFCTFAPCSWCSWVAT